MNLVSAAPAERASWAWRGLPWLLVALQLAWWSCGVWPITPVEGDEQGVLFGVEGMVRQDEALLRARYLYEVQPGSYQLLAGLVRLTGIPADAIFGTVTILGAVGFAFAGAGLLRVAFAWPLGWLVVAMLACQETITAGFYMNTSALAGAVAISAVVISAHPARLAWLYSGSLLALAGWLRADSLLIAPACLGVAFSQARDWRSAMIRTARIAATSLAAVVVLYGLSGTSLLHGADTYAQRGYFLSDWRILVETLLQLLSPLLIISSLAGIALLVRHRAYALGLLMVSGSVASFAFYGFSLSTPKYLYYAVPFILMPALYLFDVLVTALRRQSLRVVRFAGLAAVVAVLADGLLGLRTLRPEERFFTTTTWASLVSITPRAKTFELVLGSGELVLNADGFRLRTGHWFAPLSWHREKTRLQRELATMRSVLATAPEITLLWSGWVPLQLVRRELFAAGFRPEPALAPSPRQTWRKDARRTHLAFLGYVGSPYQPPGPAPAGLATKVTYLIGDSARRVPTEIADGRRWHLISEVPEGFISLYQLR